MAIWRAASEVGHPFFDAATLDEDGVIVKERYMPAAEITVAERDGAVVGFIAMLGQTVGGLFVDPTGHRGGAGRSLIEHEARKRGPLDVEVYEANSDARAFYAACGFVEIGWRPLDDRDRPRPLIAMRRS